MALKNPGENARAVAALERTYRAAAGRVLAILSKLGPASRSGAGPAALKQVEGIIRKLDRTARAWTEREIPTIYRKSQAITTNRLALFGAEKSRRFKASRHDRAAQKVATAAYSDLAKANRTILRIAKKYVSLVDQGRRAAAKLQALTGEEGATIGEWAAEAVAEGQTRRTLQNRIMDYLRGQLSDGKFIVINGRNYKLSNYSELVAGARLREAATEATINAAREYDHDLVEIPAKGGSCEECIDIEGKVYSLSGNDPKYPKLTKEKTPPIHPRCRHILRVTSESALSFREVASS